MTDEQPKPAEKEREFRMPYVCVDASRYIVFTASTLRNYAYYVQVTWS